MGGSRDSLVLRGGAGLLLAVRAARWGGLLIVTAVLGEEEEEPMLNRLLVITTVLTALGLLALFGATPPYTTAQRVSGVLTMTVFLALSGLILAFLVQPLWTGKKDEEPLSRPGLVLTLFVVGMWALLFFLFGRLDTRKGGPQWIPTGSEWRVNVSLPPWAWRQGARLD